MAGPSGATPLDFDRADFSSSSSSDAPGSGASPTCAKCSLGLSGSYYTLGDQMLCERCHYVARDAGPPGSMFTRALGALGLGFVAAVIAGLLWLLVTELTGYEIGLIAIAVGFLVGLAVKIGARGVGGAGYQLLAVFLTYSAIVMTYVPSLVTELRSNEEMMAGIESGVADGAAGAAFDPEGVETGVDGESAPGVVDPASVTFALYVLSIPIAYAAPFLMGFENLIGLAIIGFALYEAWKINKHVALELKGPFRLGANAPSVG